MRDLFQVVFELKKKEIELAKQQLENKALLAASRYISSANLEAAKVCVVVLFISYFLCFL